MVNKPEELADAPSEHDEGSGQFATSEGGEEEQSYEDLLDQYGGFRKFEEGEVLKGTVLKITDTAAIVDIGYKSEGLIPISEFRNDSGEIEVVAGDTVDVFIEKTEDRDGHIVLSKEKAEKVRVWVDVEKAYNEGAIVTGRVIERIKGGLSVDIGVRAFLPGSQIDVRPIKNLDSLRGQEIECRVIKLNRKRGNIVLSRKIVLEEQLDIRKSETLANLEEGAIIEGVVKNITDYGVFVDLGGLDGLLHVTDLSWGRVNHPSDMFKVGDETSVKILKFDREKERVSLGFKQLSPDPWTVVQERYPVGSRVSGRVVNITDYGAFVELETGVEGLIHVSEMSWSKRVKHPSKVLEAGQEVEALVLDLDGESRRDFAGSQAD